MTPHRVYNFSPGPATLPLSVLEEAQRDLLALPGLGISVLEISHRSPWFDAMYDETVANLRQLLHLPAHYQVLFLQGGANLQFSMAPINFLRGPGRSADYILTGEWSQKALKEAQREGTSRVAWSGAADNFTRTPASAALDLDPQAVYVHYTSNETIQGVQFPTEPETGDVPLICDASSDFLSRPLAIERYGLIYAGAQKNAGPAGVTIVIIRDDLLAGVPAGLPVMLDYRLQAEKKSVYNTPPVFAIYIVMLVTRWLLHEVGGLEQMAARNQQKAALLYEVLDQSGDFYRGHAHPDSRSLMNVTFRLPTPQLEQAFVAASKAAGLDELQGHRSVGGIRASIYNAMSLEGVTALRDFMLAFKAQNFAG
jgi:phosphoserine aminotransferase